ncbi:MAG: peroxiredoxin [Thermodesulfobacteriota bacterium]
MRGKIFERRVRAMRLGLSVVIGIIAVGLFLCTTSEGREVPGESMYKTGPLKPRDSEATIKVGDKAPEFTLPAVSGEKVSLSHYRGKKNVAISFVPAAWTPVCSQQWPGYNIAQELFEKNNTVLLGISVDNIPTLYAWTKEMGKLWFPVLADFWPHGAVARSYGVLRSDGVAERAVFVIDKDGVVRYVDIHDINQMPRLEELMRVLEQLPK